MNRTPVLPILLGAYVAGVVSAAVLGGPWPLTFALGGLVGSALLLRRGTPAIAAIVGTGHSSIASRISLIDFS